MKESPLINKSKAFALEVLKVCKELRATKCEGVFCLWIDYIQGSP